MSLPIQWIAQIDATGYALAITLPGECIGDCSARGDVAESVAYWVERLGFDPPFVGTAHYLAASGGWSAEEVADHARNCERLLWIVCCDLRDQFAPRD